MREGGWEESPSVGDDLLAGVLCWWWWWWLVCVFFFFVPPFLSNLFPLTVAN